MSLDLLVIPGYRLGAEIGRGGFGAVRLAQRDSDGLTVAVKVLHRLLDDDTRSRFEAEIQVMGTLAWHPNIVRIIDAGHAEDHAYIVMEYLPQGSLGARLRAGGPVAPEDVIRHSVQAATGLQVAHNAGLLHRDVKPDNLLVGVDGLVKVSDFGVALAAGPAVSNRGATGTLAFSAPELLGGGSASAASDIYALGATMFALLTGDAAFHRATDESAAAMILRAYREPVPDLRPLGVPEPLARVIERTMAKSPQERPASADHVARELAGAANTLGVALPNLIPAGHGVKRSEAGGQAPSAATLDRPPPEQRARAQRMQRIATRVSAVALAIVAVSVITVANFGDRARPPADNAAEAPPTVLASPAPDFVQVPPAPAPPPAPPPATPAPAVQPDAAGTPFGLDQPALAVAGDGTRRYAVTAVGVTSFDLPDGTRSVVAQIPGVQALAVGGGQVGIITSEGDVRLLTQLLDPVFDIGIVATDLVHGGGFFWAATAEGVIRIDAQGAVQPVVGSAAAVALAADDSVVWVINSDLSVQAIDPSTGTLGPSGVLTSPALAAAAAPDGALLVAQESGLTRVDRDGRSQMLAQISGVQRITVDQQGTAYVLVGGQVSQITAAGEVTPIEVGGPASSLGATGGTVLVGLSDPPSVIALD
ncbi:MAG: serine/threonine-protein kinase [Euzebya sp.]